MKESRMKGSLSNFALVDVGSSKVALVVPQLVSGASADERIVSSRCCLVEYVAAEKLSNTPEIARAEAFRRARLRAEAILHTRLRKVFLLATEPSLKLVPPTRQTDYQSYRQSVRDSRASNEEMIVLNVVATDRNRRPLSFYAMLKRRWQFYTRLATYAGVSITGFVFPAIALGQALLHHRRALTAAAQERGVETVAEEKSFIILDIGSHTTGVAVFDRGIPCACGSWEFGTTSIVAALAETFALTHARAAAVLRTAVFSSSFLDSILTSASDPDGGILLERRFPRTDLFANKTRRAHAHGEPSPASLSLGATTQEVAQQGVARIGASLYCSLFTEISRFLKRATPHFSRDAPLYATGGGSMVAGSLVLASHVLARCVFPYPCSVARFPTRSSAERVAASCALAALSVLAGGAERTPALLSSAFSRPYWSQHLKMFSSREASRDSFSS